MLLLLDNYDSFTFNLFQYLRELGEDVLVVRNDQITVEDCLEMNPDRIVISPGPCTPKEAGVSVELVRAFAGVTPILGVCLGHQCVGHSYGGTVASAGEIMHGKTSFIHHDNKGVFTNLPNPFEATRYHSLIIEKNTLPSTLEVSAWTGTVNHVDEIMGIRHKDHEVEGVQFHPESIFTKNGHDLLQNFLHIKKRP